MKRKGLSIFTLASDCCGECEYGVTLSNQIVLNTNYYKS